MLHTESGAANQEGSYRIIKPHKSPRSGVTSCQSGILAATVASASTGIMVNLKQSSVSQFKFIRREVFIKNKLHKPRNEQCS